MEAYNTYILDPETGDKVEFKAKSVLERNALIIKQINALKHHAVDTLCKIGLLFLCAVILMSAGRALIPLGHIIVIIAVAIYAAFGARPRNPIKEFRYTWQCLSRWEQEKAVKIDSLDARIATPEE